MQPRKASALCVLCCSTWIVAQRASIPPRIVLLTVEPATIGPGESATLRWAVENPGAITINHGIGIVTPRGIRQITPSATISEVRGRTDDGHEC